MKQIIGNGTVGTISSFLGVLTTFQEQLEHWVRICGGVLGIIIGLITLYRLLRYGNDRASH